MKMTNDHLIFEMAEEPPWTVSVTVRRTGKVWRCEQAPLTTRYWEFYLYRDQTRSLSDFEHVNFRGAVHDDIATAAFEIADLSLFLNLDFRLRGDELDVRIPVSQINEACPHEYRLMDVELLPGFGALQNGADGYLLLSNFMGTICKLRHTAPAVLDSPVYGTFNWNTDIPCFGAVESQDGFFVNILSGDCDATIRSFFSHGVGALNWSHARFHYRYVVSDDHDRVDRLARYSFLSGSDATWQAMARRYRQQLLEERDGVAPVSERRKTQPAIDHCIDSLHLSVSGGGKPRIPGRTGNWADPRPARAFRVSTTFDDLIAILKSLQQDEKLPISVMYCGIWREGHDGIYQTKTPLERYLGGNRGFARLMEYANANNCDIEPHDNFTDLYDTSGDFCSDDVVRMVNGDVRRGGIWYGGHAYICCPVVARDKFVEKHYNFMASLGKTQGCYLLDTYAGPWLHVCYHPAHPLNRRQFAEQIGANMEYTRERFGMVECETLATHSIAHMDMSGVCLAPAFEPERRPWYADKFVPFSRIVHHGLVLGKMSVSGLTQPYSEDAARQVETRVLKLLALGILPELAIEPRTFESWRPFLLDTYANRLKPLAKLQYALLEDCDESEDAIVAKYSDGSVVELDLRARHLALKG